MTVVMAGALSLSCALARRAAPSRPVSLNIPNLSATSPLIPPTASLRHAGFWSQRRAFAHPGNAADVSTSPIASRCRSFHSSPSHALSSAEFSYHIAASYSAKSIKSVHTDQPSTDGRGTIDSLGAGRDTIRQEERPESGQDAFFYSQVGTTGTRTFGVADGVGGWVDSGIDSAAFSHGLVGYMASAARTWPRGGKQTTSLHPKDLLQIGYDKVIKDKNIIGGGSTACLAIAEPDGTVEVANLGDSGFMHLGLNAVRHFTHPQTHAFNTPYQLSKTPEKMMIQMAIFGGPSTLSDLPKESSVTNHQVRHGDVLIFATDGVWDNLSPQDALGIVSRQMIDFGAWVERKGTMQVSPGLVGLVEARHDGHTDGASLQAKLAAAIAKEAKKTSLDTRRDGPFAKEVQKHYPHENWHGGKPDDIAVVTAVVVKNRS